MVPEQRVAARNAHWNSTRSCSRMLWPRRRAHGPVAIGMIRRLAILGGLTEPDEFSETSRIRDAIGGHGLVATAACAFVERHGFDKLNAGRGHRRRRPRLLRRRRRGRPRRRRRRADRRGAASRSTAPGRWSRSSPRPRRRRTASRPASARWPPGTSRPRCAPSCSARWSARTPPAPVPRSSARWCAALMLLRLSTLATGPHRRTPRDGAADRRAADARASRRWCASTARSAAPATSRRSSHCALALMGEGDVRDADGCADAGRRRARRRRARRRSSWRAKEGLALINGTDGMLGMLVLAITDLRMLLRTADIAAAMSVEGQLGTDRVFAAELQAIRPQPGQALSAANLTALLADSGVVASHRGPGLQPGAGRLLAALLAAGARRRPRHRRARRHGRRPRAGQRGRQPGRAAERRPGRVQRQLPRRPGRLRARLPRDRRRRRRVDQRAAHRPVPRQGPQPRAAAVPRRRPGRRQRAHDRAVHPGRDRLRAQAARRPGVASTRSPPARCRRTTCRWAGRPPASCAARSTG